MRVNIRDDSLMLEIQLINLLEEILSITIDVIGAPNGIIFDNYDG